MSDFEMDALDQEVEAVANSNHGYERPKAAACVGTAEEKCQKGFWEQLDDAVHYKRFRRNRMIRAIVWIAVCILAAAALISVMYIPVMLPYVVNIGVAAFLVAAAIIMDRTFWRTSL